MSALVTEYFFAPLNVGDIADAEGIGRAGSIDCGGVLRTSLKIDESGTIAEAKFKSAGCSYLVAAGSFLTSAICSKTTGEAAALCRAPNAIVSQRFGEWPAERNHCAALAAAALVAAIKNYSETVRDEWSGDEALICTCFCVSERTIESAIQAGGLRTTAEVTRVTRAGGGCQSCFPLIEDILDQHACESDFLLRSRGNAGC